eukprot:CAMPEP_0115089026 /NCGR_PEP_ID=MMETSP0227-20121206/24391_1 /TAXON_ID=89957 /ORGANISM="Polarella glacialis, Strain CCMP 1383" /LENGTH=43 /DNA_ID= /DNA_START= /DNA_END= /DNA_ORIENTATION=
MTSVPHVLCESEGLLPLVDENDALAHVHRPVELTQLLQLVVVI